MAGILVATEVQMPSQSGSGTLTIATPATSTNRTLTLPDATGTILTSGSALWTRATAVTLTNQTTVDFTGIPSNASIAMVVFDGVSTSTGALPRVQLGTSSGFVTTGYTGVMSLFIGTGGATNLSGGFDLYDNAPTAAASWYGVLTLCLRSSNVWVGSGNFCSLSRFATSFCNGSISLPAAFDRIRLTTSNGTDTLDAGTVNIMYQ